MSVTFMESSSPPNEGRTITPVHNLGAVKQMFDKLAAVRIYSLVASTTLCFSDPDLACRERAQRAHPVHIRIST